MSELPRVDNLIRLADAAADTTNWILDCDLGYRRVKQQVNEIQCFFSQQRTLWSPLVPMQPA
jgi:hypothetical protein